MNGPSAVAYAGFPGAGKTEAARLGVELVGGERVSMGEAVKEVARKELGPDATSHEIGEWATASREKHGETVMAERIVQMWREGEAPTEPVHIEGVRSVEEIAVFEDYFGDVPVMFVLASAVTRLFRLRHRGRDGESGFSIDDLEQRDAREANWGLQELGLSTKYRFENEHELSTLRNRLGSLLQTRLGLPRRQ